MPRQRLSRLLTWTAVLLAAGSAYAVFVSVTGLFIPCPFRQVTQLLCPGCGVSHLCLALLHMDLPGAWAANPGLFLLLPLLALFLLYRAVCYVLRGSSPLSRRESVLVWLMVLWLVLWGFVRNFI
ncbi:MAG: DUF2752 domain-containing protein [Oscillospiraceae bacterium]|nr:DUF2752 domain-containing protein [Oscillospiraceae bacterium]